jgi:hypothetical protein
VEPTLVPDKDCNDIIGGEAVADECGECGGPGKTGCDSTCGSALQLDCEGVCDGDATTECNGDCRGNGILKYYCDEDTDNDGLLNIESRSLRCIDASIPGNCEPNFDSCLFMNCDIDSMYIGTVINCQGKLPSSDDCDEASATCINFQDFFNDGECDYLYSNCEEFNFDDGDCDLVDCMGTHFTDELCVSAFDAGCTTTTYIVDSTMDTEDGSTTVEHDGSSTIYAAMTVTGISIPNGATVDTVINSITFELSVAAVDGTNGGDAGNNLTLTFGIEPFLGDGECDESLVLDEDFGLELNFNCAEWDYDGGDCESTSGRIIYGHKFANSNLNSLSSPIP